jgi:hypothetical protein
MTSDFSSLTSAALNAIYRDDLLPLAVLADFLADYGDERERRLRLRLKRYSSRLDFLKRGIASYRLRTDLDKVKAARWEEDDLCKIRSNRANFVSYLIRLMSVPSGQRVPRERVGGGYAVSEPQF